MAVDASSPAWQNYQGGVLTDADNCGTTLDHAVLAVGYNNNAATPYLYLQNQWGTGRQSVRGVTGSGHAVLIGCGVCMLPPGPNVITTAAATLSLSTTPAACVQLGVKPALCTCQRQRLRAPRVCVVCCRTHPSRSNSHRRSTRHSRQRRHQAPPPLRRAKLQVAAQPIPPPGRSAVAVACCCYCPYWLLLSRHYKGFHRNEDWGGITLNVSLLLLPPLLLALALAAY